MSKTEKTEEKLKKEIVADKDVATVKKKKQFAKKDYYLFSTIALAIISLCALVVSIYQTNVLSGQQEVMDEQQKIMQQNARAQLWPSLRVNYTLSYENNTLEGFDFIISNDGTGPAIIENVEVGYDGKYAPSWNELWNVANLPDSISRTTSIDQLSNRVLQPGEKYIFLSLSGNHDLMNFVNKDFHKKSGIEMQICYKSVFKEHWSLKGKFPDIITTSVIPLDSCTISERPSFIN